jgi:DNA-binding MurR/RpiR family transcriptional regulator
MELRIGVVHTPKELNLEVEQTADEVVALIDAALQGGVPIVWLTDAKGRRIGTPVDKIAYVEINDNDAGTRVGFGR